MEKALLIIDDNQEIIDVVSVAVKDLFEKIFCANTVEESEKKLDERTFSFILLDINLKGRNGAEVIKYIQANEQNPNKNTPIIIISGILTPQFIERNHHKFVGMLMKPFDHDELRKIILNSLYQIEATKEEVKEEGIDNDQVTEEIPYLKCELPFPIPDLEKRVAKVIDQIRKSPKLKSLFSQIKIDRSSDNYILSHIGMMVNISTAISIQMDWNTDKTLEKFVYASYLHDMALSNRPDLARINSLELEAMKDSLSSDDYKLVFEHPNIAVRSIEELSDIPNDVATIVRQHHEMPKENGFPTKCGHLKITPLSCVFIVAHDLTEFILVNPKWTMEAYIKVAKDKFKGAHFSKILASLIKTK